jgi:hypothetical protein
VGGTARYNTPPKNMEIEWYAGQAGNNKRGRDGGMGRVASIILANS